MQRQTQKSLYSKPQQQQQQNYTTRINKQQQLIKSLTSSPQKYNNSQSMNLQQTVKQKYLKQQIDFLLILKDKICKMHHYVKQTSRILINIQKNNIKDNIKDNKQKNKILEMTYDIKTYTQQIQNIIKYQIQTINSNQRTISNQYQKYIYPHQIKNNHLNINTNINTNRNIRLPPLLSSITSSFIRQKYRYLKNDLNLYYSISQNNTQEELLIYQQYQKSVQRLSQKLLNCEKIVGQLSQNVRKKGKPENYGHGIKRYTSKGYNKIDLFLKTRNNVLKGLIENFQLKQKVKNVLNQKLKQQSNKKEEILLLNNEYDQIEEIQAFVKNQIGYKNYKLYKNFDVDFNFDVKHKNKQNKNKLKRVKSQAFKINPIYYKKVKQYVQSLQIQKVNAIGIKFLKNQSKKNIPKKIEINQKLQSLRNNLFNEILINFTKKIRKQNQNIQQQNKKLKIAIQQKKKLQALQILRKNHTKQLIEREYLFKNKNCRFNTMQEDYHELSQKDYILLLELQAEKLRKKYDQMQLQARVKKYPQINLNSPRSNDYPLEKRDFKRLLENLKKSNSLQQQQQQDQQMRYIFYNQKRSKSVQLQINSKKTDKKQISEKIKIKMKIKRFTEQEEREILFAISVATQKRLLNRSNDKQVRRLYERQIQQSSKNKNNFSMNKSRFIKSIETTTGDMSSYGNNRSSNFSYQR